MAEDIVDGVLGADEAGNVPTVLTISNVAGAITVRSGEAGEIRWHARKYGKEDAVAATHVETKQDRDGATIKTVGGEGVLNRRLCAVDYEVFVPIGCRVEARAVSSNIDVQGIEAALTASTVSGSIVAEGIRERCALKTVSGDARLRDVTGQLSVRSTSGDVRLETSRLDSFNVHTVSGDFVAETPLVDGSEYLTHTVSGDVTLILPAGTGATVQLKTISGSVRSELPAEIYRSGRRHWQGRINGGGANVSLSSVSGDLCLRAGDGEAPAAGPSRNDVTEVLRRLQQGEIDVDQAMELINAR